MAAPVHAAAQAPGADFGPAAPLKGVTATTAPRLGAIALDTRRLAGTAVVTGTRPPGARIDLRAPCAAWTCHAVAPVRADGRWTAGLLLVRPVKRSAAVVSSYAAANARPAGLAADPLVGPALRIVPWAAEVAHHRSWLARDRVHATAVGYAERAQLVAEAVARPEAAQPT